MDASKCEQDKNFRFQVMANFANFLYSTNLNNRQAVTKMIDYKREQNRNIILLIEMTETVPKTAEL